MFWLIQEDVLRVMREARVRGVQPTAEEQRAHEERVAARGSNGPRNLTLAGDVAEIRIEGVLTQRPDFWAWLLGLGNTTYADIQQAIALALADPSVKSVRFFVDSPGGQAAGLFDTFAAIEQLRGEKPVTVRAASAHSAAYGLAAVAGSIEAQNAASMFGSVGVAISFWMSDSVLDLTNTESPDKRPDLTTEEGRAVVVRELDAIFDLFAGAIAKGRDLSTKDVVENFGRGASFVAGEAKRRGMIDTIARPSLRMVPEEAASAAGSQPKNASAESGGGRKRTMNLEELRSQHPDAYNAAVQVGVTQERDRVVAHLTMGETSGDITIAAEAIRSGDAMTQTLTARYLAAGMNRSDRRTRQKETDAAGAAADGAQATETVNDSQVLKVLEERRGKKAS